MAQAYDTQRPTAGGETTAPETGGAPATPATTFSTSGSIPAVDTTTVAAGPTASERAFDQPKGPGVTALEKLLAEGPPRPEQVVDVIDAHPSERDAMLAVVEARLGAGFVKQLGKGMAHQRANVERRETPGKQGLDKQLRVGPQDTISASVARDARGTTVDASETHSFDHGSVSGNVHPGPNGPTGAFAATYDDRGKHVDGNVTRDTDQTSLHLGASDQVSPQLSVSGQIDHVSPDHRTAQTTIGVSERYRFGQVIEGVDVERGNGTTNYIKSTASVDAGLGKGVYAGGFGSYQLEDGHHGTAQLGANLTFTPSEKTALTLAGVLDQSGALETRLQLDVFKSKVASVGDLADHKKDALVSLFVSYAQGGNHHMLDDRFGAPQVGTTHDAGAGQVMAGIRINF